MLKYARPDLYDATIEGIIEDVLDYEEEIREGFQDKANYRVDMESILEDIMKLIKKHSKSLHGNF